MKHLVEPTHYEILKDIALPVATGVIGWFANQFWMSQKDRKDVEQKNFENSVALRNDHDKAYDAYVTAISEYTAAPVAREIDFAEISSKGDRYFLQLNFLCAAILSDKVDASVRNDVMMAKIEAAANRSLPHHYETLQKIASVRGFSYSGELRREDYSAIFAVVEKFGKGGGTSA